MRRLVCAAGFLLLLLSPAPARAADPLRVHQWGLSMIGADAAHGTATGTGAIVAVVDTGAQLDHPDLSGRLIAGHDFIDGDDSPRDENGHGTHVAGTVAANTGNGVGVESVAPGAKVLVVRVLDADGGDRVNSVPAGIDWAVDHGADVINLSLGPELPLTANMDRAYNDAISRALARGVVVVAAAGNNSFPACEQPAATQILCVGSVDRRGNRSFFSDFGDGLAITAPGGSALMIGDEDILSTYPTYFGDRSGYDYLAGTSQATPHVAGVAALLVSLGLHGTAVRDQILRSARDVGDPGPDSQYGVGILDARAAVAGVSRPGGGTSSSGSSTGAPRLGAAGRISVARSQRIRDVLKRGFRVRCTAGGSGRCSVTVRLGRRTIASASARVRLGQTVTVVARINKRGRSLLRSARRASVTLRVSLPGARTQTIRVALRR